MSQNPEKVRIMDHENGKRSGKDRNLETVGRLVWQLHVSV